MTGDLTFDHNGQHVEGYLSEPEGTPRAGVVASQVVDAALNWLKAEHGVAKTGCIGFCMGGGLTLAAAMRPTSNVDAVHVFYGGGMPSAEELSTITAPVMGSYGATDESIPADQVDMLRSTLEGSVPTDVKLYDGAGHSFFNAGEAHHAEAAADAWERTLQWFGDHLA